MVLQSLSYIFEGKKRLYRFVWKLINSYMYKHIMLVDEVYQYHSFGRPLLQHFTTA